MPTNLVSNNKKVIGNYIKCKRENPKRLGNFYTVFMALALSTPGVLLHTSVYAEGGLTLMSSISSLCSLTLYSHKCSKKCTFKGSLGKQTGTGGRGGGEWGFEVLLRPGVS